jgi:BlaI family transcriptional regulator, penicillinase repressor
MKSLVSGSFVRTSDYSEKDTTKFFVDITKTFVDSLAAMSRTSPLPRPTDAELSILRVLWERGPSTVRQVHDVLSRERPTAYTTALKLLQIMTDKGLVRRDETERTHVYHPRLSEEQTQRQLVRDLLDRAFGGSAAKLVVQALAARRATPEELVEIRRLIETRREVRDERDS